MEAASRPQFALYVVWHPSCDRGSNVAKRLRQHIGDNRFDNVAGRSGVGVMYRSTPAPGERIPRPIDWNEAESTAVIALVDSTLADDSAWFGYVRELAQTARTKGLLARLFPVAMESGSRELQFDEQAWTWNRLGASDAEREQRLIRNLVLEFSRMLRHRLALLSGPEEAGMPLTGYLEKIQVFISHSKHDNDGEPVAKSIRDWLHENSGLSSFFDVYDIPAGLSFRDVLLHQIGNSVVMALHTDSYSSREWCRREVIEAKRRQVPMIVVDCLRDMDRRSMPYLGNVPVVRMCPDRKNQIGRVIGCMLDEVFQTYLWRCRVERFVQARPDVLFMARPPELISLSSLPSDEGESIPTMVYPEPPLSAAEARLFAKVAPEIRTWTLGEWLEGVQ